MLLLTFTSGADGHGHSTHSGGRSPSPLSTPRMSSASLLTGSFFRVRKPVFTRSSTLDRSSLLFVAAVSQKRFQIQVTARNSPVSIKERRRLPSLQRASIISDLGFLSRLAATSFTEAISGEDEIVLWCAIQICNRAEASLSNILPPRKLALLSVTNSQVISLSLFEALSQFARDIGRTNYISSHCGVKRAVCIILHDKVHLSQPHFDLCVTSLGMFPDVFEWLMKPCSFPSRGYWRTKSTLSRSLSCMFAVVLTGLIYPRRYAGIVALHQTVSSVKSFLDGGCAALFLKEVALIEVLGFNPIISSLQIPSKSAIGLFFGLRLINLSSLRFIIVLSASLCFVSFLIVLLLVSISESNVRLKTRSSEIQKFVFD